MGTYNNKCVVKLFDISSELIMASIGEYLSDTLTVEIKEEYKDVTIYITNTSDNDIAFNNLVSKLAKEFYEFLYADREVTLAECLVEKLTRLGKTVAVAESLTGGLIASSIVAVPGASNVFHEGIVAYNPASKVRRLHVPIALVEKYGTVNPEVARGMCLGLVSNKEVDFAFSTTGIAGPDSDEFNTPIGRVYIGFGDKRLVDVKELNLTGTREEIRRTAVNYALFFMLRYIVKYIK